MSTYTASLPPSAIVVIVLVAVGFVALIALLIEAQNGGLIEAQNGGVTERGGLWFSAGVVDPICSGLKLLHAARTPLDRPSEQPR